MLPADVTYTFFMLVRTTPAWLRKPPRERFAFLGSHIEPVLKQHPAVKMRFFDSEAFNASISDVIMWETRQLSEYQAVVEKLRETEFWDALFEVREIVPAIENAYAHHYGVQPAGT
jgi:hypothetical protein